MTHGQPDPRRFGPNPYGQPQPGYGAPGYGAPGYGQPPQPPGPPRQPPGQPSFLPAGQPGPGQYGQPQPYGSPAYGPPGGQPPAYGPPGGQPPAQQPPGSAWAPVQPPFSTPVPQPAPRKPEYVPVDLPLSTSGDIPGREITGVVGVVVGTTTRTTQPRVGPDTVGLLARARQDALLALADMARQAGGDAVVSVRFDGGPAADGLHELTAYGTAVTLAPVPGDQQPTPVSAASATSAWGSAPSASAPVSATEPRTT